MSEHDIMHKLAQMTHEVSNKMSVEQLRLYQELITKKYEMKVAEDAFMAALDLEEVEEMKTGEILNAIRKVLEDQVVRLSGTEAVILACYHKHLEGDKDLDTKRLNLFLQSFGRKPANTTKIIDTLDKKRLVEKLSHAAHSHKTFSLTPSGQDRGQELLLSVGDERGHECLAVVD